MMDGACSLGPTCAGEGSKGRYLRKKGVLTLLRLSKQWNDGLFSKRNAEYYLHDSCYKAYSRGAPKGVYKGS